MFAADSADLTRRRSGTQAWWQTQAHDDGRVGIDPDTDVWVPMATTRRAGAVPAALPSAALIGQDADGTGHGRAMEKASQMPITKARRAARAADGWSPQLTDCWRLTDIAVNVGRTARSNRPPPGITAAMRRRVWGLSGPEPRS